VTTIPTVSSARPPAGRPLATSPAGQTHPGSRPLGWWGVVGLIATEATLFSLLLFVNFYLRANAATWPPPGVEDPELVLSGIRSVILIGSSVPVAIAERAAKRGDEVRMRRYLIITFVMGAVFLAGHIQEYVTLWPKLTFRDSSYGSIFYTLTGLHALHLIVGLGVLAYLVVQSLRGTFEGQHHPTPVACGILYWHFVDVVWVAVYSSLYLSVTLL
jgi:heme/copper-type cytochrome/quinol oxidase subunit 3